MLTAPPIQLSVIQVLFDRVVAHASTMQDPSASSGGCVYRGPDGAKCFIGALISDEHYFKGLECQSPTNSPALANAIIKSQNLGSEFKFTTDELWFLDNLQCVHDTYYQCVICETKGKWWLPHPNFQALNLRNPRQYETFQEWLDYALPAFATAYGLSYTA